jgi:hypothetical protein
VKDRIRKKAVYAVNTLKSISHTLFKFIDSTENYIMYILIDKFTFGTALFGPFRRIDFSSGKCYINYEHTPKNEINIFEFIWDNKEHTQDLRRLSNGGNWQTWSF